MLQVYDEKSGGILWYFDEDSDGTFEVEVMFERTVFFRLLRSLVAFATNCNILVLDKTTCYEFANFRLV